MLILVVALLLEAAVTIKGSGYYQGYSPSSNIDPYTRYYYTSSPKQYSSGYSAEADQYASPSSSSVSYGVQPSDQDGSQEYASKYNSAKSYSLPYQPVNDYSHLSSQGTSQASAYSNAIDENYAPAEEYTSYSHSDDYPTRNHDFSNANYQPVSYETSPNKLSLPTSYYSEHDNSNVEVSNHNTNIDHPASNNYLPTAPQTTINVNHDPIPLNQHIHITKHIPVPVYKPIHIPVAKPFRVEIPHPILIPVPKPYPVQFPIAQPVAVPVVKEIAIPVEKLVPYPVEKRVPYTVEKHVPYKVEKLITVHVPQAYPVKIPIVKTVIHKVKTYGRGYYRGSGWY